MDMVIQWGIQKWDIQILINNIRMAMLNIICMITSQHTIIKIMLQHMPQQQLTSVRGRRVDYLMDAPMGHAVEKAGGTLRGVVRHSYGKEYTNRLKE